ncbi:hypothetical protein HYZ99_01470, partial [Candidatus Peregrinibacteria bacterium]|nr:hypothetical protein [Candidatus Peregrinibacteria bacterium]
MIKLVASLVNDIIMPPLGLLIGKVDFASLFVSLSGEQYRSIAEAKEAGAPTINPTSSRKCGTTPDKGLLCCGTASEADGLTRPNDLIVRIGRVPRSLL